jgi:dihydroxy-acid dehydratase
VKNGDRITLDVPNRRLELLVDDKELETRRKAWTPPAPHPGSDRGYSGLFQREVLQADQGVDFAFLGPAKT